MLAQGTSEPMRRPPLLLSAEVTAAGTRHGYPLAIEAEKVEKSSNVRCTRLLHTARRSGFTTFRVV